MKKHKHLVPQLWGIHALIECNTLSHVWGIGKVVAFKVIAKCQQLHLLGNETDDFEGYITKAVECVATCYGSKVKDCMSELCYKVWLTKTARICPTTTPKMKSLPPNT